MLNSTVTVFPVVSLIFIDALGRLGSSFGAAICGAGESVLLKILKENMNTRPLVTESVAQVSEA